MTTVTAKTAVELTLLLQGFQGSDGLYRSYAISGGHRQKPLPTAYFTFLTLPILDSIADPDIKQLLSPQIERAVRAIMRERGQDNTFNYWKRNSKRFSANRVPDDWDDSALAYVCLNHRGSKYRFSKPYHLLKRSKHSGSDLFETWILPGYPERWHDLDLWVNLNILFWLADESVTPAPLWRHICTALLEETLSSQYYPDYCSAYYFFVRTLELPSLYMDLEQTEPGLSTTAIATLTAISNRCSALAAHSAELTDMQAAWICATLALTNPNDTSFGKLLERVASRTLKVQGREALPAIYGWQRGRTDRKVFDGSPALEAALALLATDRKLQADQGTRLDKATKQAEVEIASVANEFGISAEAREALSFVLHSDFTNEVFRLPEEVGGLIGQIPTSGHARQQGLANAMGWAYFWIDDALLDGHDLPPNALHLLDSTRKAYYSLQEACVSPDHAFWDDWKAIHASYTKIRSYETHALHFDPEKRPPTATNLLQWNGVITKKFGPYIAAVLASLASEASGENYVKHARTLKDIFRHYLIAKQLSDDARDCLPDIREGRLTQCTSMVISYLDAAAPVSAHTDKEIETVFIQQVSHEYNRMIRAHLGSAKRTLRRMYPETHKYSAVKQKITAMENSVKLAEVQHAELLAIIQDELNVSK